MTKQLFSLLLISCTILGFTQAQDCRDRVVLKNGSVFTGQIKAYDAAGTLLMESWNGAELKFPAAEVKKITQNCKGERRSLLDSPYNFKEHGWFHATRATTLSGQNGLGLGLQHCSGFQFKRLLGIGLGIGMEQFNWEYDAPATIPVFLEVRSYLRPKNISPYLAMATGYGFSSSTKNRTNLSFNEATQWFGGWMAQGQAGYRIGRHFEVFLGIHFQYASRKWINPWWSGERTDYYIYKRMEFGVGIRL